MASRWKPAAALMVVFMLSCGEEPTPGRDLLLSASFEASAVGQPPARHRLWQNVHDVKLSLDTSVGLYHLKVTNAEGKSEYLEGDLLKVPGTHRQKPTSDPVEPTS